MQTIYEKSQPGSSSYSIPFQDKAFVAFSPSIQRDPSSLFLPQISEPDLVRHFAQLSSRNRAIETNFFPLGSCTMKYNPKMNEQVAAMHAFTHVHPMAEDHLVQGSLKVTYDLLEKLCSMCGMHAGTLCSNAGAQGEFVGLEMIAQKLKSEGQHQRKQVLIPDSAHGTNPASARMLGFEVITLETNERGQIDVDQIKQLVSDETAALMLTNPSTLVLFMDNIIEVTEVIHKAGGYVYYDGANLNAIVNVCRPAEMGFDVMHINLHKTFSTPHGGGGPGSGPVLANDQLSDFLPSPIVTKDKELFQRAKASKTMGRISMFMGNFGIYLRAWSYILFHGDRDLYRNSLYAVLNANYLRALLKRKIKVCYEDQYCMHEFVISLEFLKDKGIKAADIAKMLLDYGYYAPTMYFPLTVKECMLIEPTETESKQTLDQFAKDLCEAIEVAMEEPKKAQEAPHQCLVRRVNETLAARNPILTDPQATAH